MSATRTEDEVHPLLQLTLRVDLGLPLTRPMPHVGPHNTAAGLELLYDSAPFDDVVDLRDRPRTR